MIATYARAVDDRDIDGIVGCFTADGRIDFEGGQTSGEGEAGIRRGRSRTFTARPRRARYVDAPDGDTLVTIDGVEAHAETQAVAFLASGSLGTVTTRGLRYSDDLQGADGWRITHRIHRSIWQTESRGELR